MFSTRLSTGPALPMHQPRKTAKQARSRATQEAILEATARILESRGRAQLTTNEIARRAGVSIGSLYQYFPNKQAILATLIRNKRAELVDQMRGELAGAEAQPPEQALDALIRAGLMHQFSRPVLALELEYLEPQLALEAETAALSEQMAQLVLTTIRRLHPAAGPEEARDVVAIVKGLLNAAAFAGETGGAALVARCRRAVLGYLDRAKEPG